MKPSRVLMILSLHKLTQLKPFVDKPVRTHQSRSSNNLTVMLVTSDPMRQMS
jgi:hypothetical protein